MACGIRLYGEAFTPITNSALPSESKVSQLFECLGNSTAKVLYFNRNTSISLVF